MYTAISLFIFYKNLRANCSPRIYNSYFNLLSNYLKNITRLVLRHSSFGTNEILDRAFKFLLRWFPAVIYAGFFGWGGSAKCFFFGGGPIFRGWNEILLSGKALKFGVIFQKFALKLIKICKIIGKIRVKYKFFGNFFKFSGRE